MVKLLSANESELFDPNKILVEAVKALGTAAYDKLKEKFLDKWKESQFKKDFGFTDDVENAKKIYEMDKTASFQTLKECIGNSHWALNFIKVGLRISDLSDVGERRKVDEIRSEIRKSKGIRPLNIVNMGSTGAIKGVINFLDNLRKNDYSKEAIIEEFESIIYNWENITIFVDKSISKDAVKIKIYDKIEKKIPLFFVFSYGSDANQIAMCSIAEMRNANLIEQKGYLPDSQPKFDGVGTKIYMWVFEYSES